MSKVCGSGIVVSVILVAMLLQVPVAGHGQVSPFRRSIVAELPYLQLPIKNGAPKRKVTLFRDGQPWRWFDVELADGEADWYAYLDLREVKGHTLVLNVDSLGLDSKAFNPVIQALEDRPTYAEPLRGQFHFSPKRGWLNDPNGLAYYKGEYHLFFQYNPYGTGWGNMHWGHAVSTDLIHWKELDIALYPDETGYMYSGGGIVDSSNSSGLGASDDAPLVLFYTAEGTWGQGVAYSVDGRTFTKRSEAVLPMLRPGNRDAKVIWHQPTNRWVMVLYVAEEDDRHAMYFFTADDLLAWQYEGKVLGGKADDKYLFECPEFYELPVSGKQGVKKWVLSGANGQYAIGTFDGKVFTPEEERIFGKPEGLNSYYAAQNFSNDPKGRIIEMGWWHTDTKIGGNSFNQSMGIPMQLGLKNTKEGIRLQRAPVEELDSLRAKSWYFTNVVVEEGKSSQRCFPANESFEMTISLLVAESKKVALVCNGLAVDYDVVKERLTIGGISAQVPLIDGRLDFRCYVDRIGVEILAADGLVYMPIAHNFKEGNVGIDVWAEGGRAIIDQLNVYQLKGIW